MKRCCTCKVEKPFTEFNKKKRNPDGLERYCRDCHKIKNKKHYQTNKESYLKSAAKWKADLKEWWKNYKQALKCQECGESRSWCLDFHHKDPTQKDSSVSAMITECKSKESILKEVEKCIVVCRNCHADIHYKLRSSLVALSF